MTETIEDTTRRTSADDVFDYLHAEILSLRLLPGARISELEVARRFNVSRQPVREAFIRLDNLNLLQIRPQRATRVRKFSSKTIMRARFVRLALECEIVREACCNRTKDDLSRLRANLVAQSAAVGDEDTDRFHTLDYEFHRLLCAAARLPHIAETIQQNKAQVDRLCLLSLSAPMAMHELLEDHAAITTALEARDEHEGLRAVRTHLSRLDETIAAISVTYKEYFED